ncbi:branched-chain amino acid ABC transporter permease [Paraburkholderia sp. RL18-101-BIB-B]|uniref:branched-chain amino acid ABC transporter permease n=1 Tax=unclassified Paraburkholderia TaxID=2615204 RepID=UPI0038BD21FF
MNTEKGSVALTGQSVRKTPRVGRVLVAAIFIALLAYSIFAENRYGQSMVMWIALNSLAAVCLRFVLLIGEKNVATAAFMGLSAYATAIATVNFGWPFIAAILLGSAVAGVTSCLFGVVCLRVKGPYFMLIGFSFTALMGLIYTKWDYVGGNAGMVGIYLPPYMEGWLPALVLSVCSVWMLILYLCERSPLGRLFQAIRDNDSIVASVGVDIIRVKVVCLVLASVAVGFVGSLTAFTNAIISPPDFQFSVAVFLLAYIMIGGQSHIIGTVIGAAILTCLDQALQGHSEWEEIVFGGAIAASMLVLPDGLLGVWRWIVEGSFWRTGWRSSLRGSEQRVGSRTEVSKQ